MQPQIKKQQVYSIFGNYFGNKLINSLTNCCPSTPSISLTFNASCDGYDDKGNLTYNVMASATYNQSISGNTTITGFFSDQPIPNWTTVTSAVLDNFNMFEQSIFVPDIQAGIPCVVANLQIKHMNPGTYYGMVTDNRGNYAAPITITFPVCPKG